LPFTGINLSSLVTTGSILLIAGVLLLTTVESRRRLCRRAGSWFFGL
jgi:hypothetical protein